jgi:hypothetical protein
MQSFMEALRMWLETTPVARFMLTYTWAWPVVESLHFLGLSLLIGTVGLFDLRLLGIAKSIPMPALHRLIKFGIAGYCLNVVTGLSFFSAMPDQYMYNPSFHFKMLFMGTAGLNVLLFYALSYRHVRLSGPGADAPRLAKIAGLVSLLMWIGVMTCGRLLTFYRPPAFYSCPWC